MLCIHAVIRSEDDNAAHCIKLRPISVHHGVKVIRNRRTWGVLVLYVVSGREIKDVWPVAAHQFNARRENEFRQFRTVDVRHRHSDEIENVFDPILFKSNLVGLFRRKADAAACTETHSISQLKT